MLKWADKNTNKKIYIYGINDRGKSIYDYCQKNNVTIAGFVVSDEFPENRENNIFHLNEITGRESALIIAVKYCYFNEIIPKIIRSGISDLYFLKGEDLEILQYYNTLFTKNDIKEVYPSRWKAYSSAKKVIAYLMDAVKIESVIDFGCGSGAWLKAAKDLNPEMKVLGLDNSNVDRSEFLEKEEFKEYDLSKGAFLSSEKYDLAISIEVAEHIEEKYAEEFIDSICSASDMILFSAAIKYQGGDHHVNEQFPSYWINEFDKRGYGYVDCIRGHFWQDLELQLHVRQNCILYVKKDRINALNDKIKEDKFVDAVHPELYEYIMKAIYEGKY